MTAEILVRHPGMHATVQDRGRFGFGHYGVPFSGPMDTYAASLANGLLANDPEDAVLEIALMGPELEFSGPTSMVLCGADLGGKINGKPIGNNRVYGIREGDVLSFGKWTSGCRAYLALRRGFQCPIMLGSRSWYGSVTGVSRLEKGMRLPYSPHEEPLQRTASVREKPYLQASILETFPGPEYNRLDPEQEKILAERSFSLDPDSNRMGIKLLEPIPGEVAPILTGPVLPGTVQLTPSGRLIVLMRDAQVTGGYPRILQLNERGINILAQKIPGEKISFLRQTL